MGDLNIEPRSNNLYNLIKSNTCFKGKGSRTDFFLTNKKYSFAFNGSCETVISDQHRIIYTVLRVFLKCTEPELSNYRKIIIFPKKTLKRTLANLSVIVVIHMIILIIFLRQS